ncbi:MAG: VWA domain-containing protein [Vicinamibacterales bacterium]
MHRGPLAFGAIALVGVGLLAAPQQPRFHGASDAVSIYATVADAEGRLVTDLTADDFEVTDDGRPVTLSLFSDAVQPITIVIMLDRSGSVERRFSQVRDAASALVRTLEAGDRARIGTFSGRIDIAPGTFTGDRDRLLDILYGDLQDPGPTPLWNATGAAIDALAGQPGRRVVLVFTDGLDSPWYASDEPSLTFDQVRARVEAEDVMVYGIGLAESCAPDAVSALRQHPLSPASAVRAQRGGARGLPPRINPPPFPPMRPPGGGLPPPSRPTDPGVDEGRSCRDQGPDPDLRTLAEVGGGGYFELRSTMNLAATFTRVAEELRQQYLLAFTPGALDGRAHRLTVRVRRPGLTVRARTGYLATPR